MTAAEIRNKIVSTVAENGGHLASSLGAVEICMALCDVFDPVRDRIVWDVGHQAYAWKILTGRDALFATIRKSGGLSGFPNPLESPADAAVSGHAGVAISVAEGYAAARDLKGGNNSVVAVTGDASIVNGTSLEALNNCAGGPKIIIVLNDNAMGISKATGSVSRLLGRIIAGARYNRIKQATRRAARRIGLGFLYGAIHTVKARIKSFFLGDAVFEKLGIRYLGPVDGHDVPALKAAFEAAKNDRRSVIVHVVTKKGKGFAPAEKDPVAWHGTGPFDIKAAASERVQPSSDTWSDVFGRALSSLARRDSRIVALTAGMPDGTGLAGFAKEFPGRFFDVGIAEGHLVAFAAGLAAGGMRPVVAVYSTFLQRAVDQIVHDVAIASLPVVICVDRAGVVGADGVTHQGLYDIPMLKCIPNLTIAQPKDAEDLAVLLEEAVDRGGPCVIRYPRGRAPLRAESSPSAPSRGAPRAAIWATGDWYPKACRIAEKTASVAVHARYIKPFDAALLEKQKKEGLEIISLENGAVSGGLGEAIGAGLRLGWPDEFVKHGPVSELEKEYGLDEESLTAKISAFLHERGRS